MMVAPLPSWSAYLILAAAAASVYGLLSLGRWLRGKLGDVSWLRLGRRY
jgi:hypothetical protein